MVATAKPSMTTEPSVVTDKEPRKGVRLAPPKITIPDLNMTLEDARQEVEDIYDHMKDFYTQEPDEVMRLCGGYHARLAEIRMYVERCEDQGNFRLLKQFRTKEVEPALKDLKHQYDIASRLLTYRQLDWEMAKVGM